MKLDLTGKTALVGGSSKGIGRAVAIELALLNANVILLSRSEDILKNLCDELPGNGNHSFLTIDISNRNLLKEKVITVLNKYQNIHILINNTGGPKSGLIHEAKETEFTTAFENHLLVNSMLTQLLLPGMKKECFGRIINILSTSVKAPIPNLGVSNTIRSAVANWAKTLSLEVAPYGITVNNILPGYTRTERLQELVEIAAQKSGKTPNEIEKEWEMKVPIGRFGLTEEIANVVAFLSSPAASYVNGINIPVDGGRTDCL